MNWSRSAISKKLPLASLLFSAIAFGGFGIALFISPQLLSIVGVEIVSPTGTNEIRAFYGGLEIGLAVFFVLAIVIPGWILPGLAVQCLTLGGAALGRIIALLIENNGVESLIYWLILAEFSGFLLGLFAIKVFLDNLKQSLN